MKSETTIWQVATNHLDYGICIFDVHSSDILYVNPAFEKIFGYSRNEITGKKFSVLFPRESTNSLNFSEITSSLHKFGHWSGNIQALKKNKSPHDIYFKASVVPIENSGKVCFSTLCEFPFSENSDSERIRNLLDASNEMINITDVETASFIYVNDTICRNTGYTKEELYAMKVYDLDHNIRNNDWQDHINSLKENKISLIKSTWTKKNGESFPVEINLSYLNMDNHKYITAFTQDISNRTIIEDTLYFLSERKNTEKTFDFFTSLAEHLGKKVGADYVFIDKFIEENKAQTIAVYSDNKIQNNIVYDLDGTPCETVKKKSFCLYPKNIQKIFPKDFLLCDLQAESYMGIPLWDSRQNPIGLIAILYKSEIKTNSMAETLLKLVAVRASAELERLEILKDLKESEQNFRQLAENLEHVLWLNEENKLIYISPSAESNFGMPLKSIYQNPALVLDFMHPDDAKTLRNLISNDQMDGFNLEFRMFMPDGTMKWIHAQNFSFELDDGNRRYVGIARDVTEQKKTTHELEKSHQTLLTVLNSLDAKVYVTDMYSFEVLFANGTVTKELGDITGTKCWESLRHNQSGPCEECPNEEILRKFEQSGVVVREEYNKHDKKWFQLRDQIITWVDGRKVRLEIATDITALKEAEEQLKNLSYVDYLTGTGNRRSFESILQNEWRRSLRTGDTLSVIMFDIDFFKEYNDNYGHREGDMALRRVARVVNDKLKRPGDVLTRYGGEEFVVFLPNTKEEGAYTLAEEIRRSVQNDKIRHEYSKVSPYLTISLGIASQNKSTKSPEDLIKNVDQALYLAKRSGRNRTDLIKDDTSLFS